MRVLLAMSGVSGSSPLDEIRDALADMGHVVDRLAGGDAAAARPRTLHELVVVDVTGPPERTKALLARLRELEPRAPMLAIGARFMVHERLAADEGGADAFVTRPLTRPELLAGIARARAARDPGR